MKNQIVSYILLSLRFRFSHFSIQDFYMHGWPFFDKDFFLYSVHQFVHTIHLERKQQLPKTLRKIINKMYIIVQVINKIIVIQPVNSFYKNKVLKDLKQNEFHGHIWSSVQQSLLIYCVLCSHVYKSFFSLCANVPKVVNLSFAIQIVKRGRRSYFKIEF